MPGVNITTAVRTGPVGTGDIVSGQVFMVGETERGPLDKPTLLRSFSDFTTYYGNYKSGNLYSHVKTFFDEGGSRCQVMRVLGSGNAAGSVDLVDSAGSATMTITAKNAGAWSANLDVDVVQADNSGFRIEVYLDDVLLLRTRDLTSTTDAINVLNASEVNHLLTASDNETSSNDPDHIQNAKQAVNTKTIGDDGSAVSDANIVTALDSVSVNLGPGAVCAPGRSGSTIWEGLRDHAAANKRIALLGFDSGDGAGDAKSNAASYYADANAKSMAFYWPHVKVPAPNVTELATGESTI